MSHSIKVATLTVIVCIGLYLVFSIVIVRKIEALNTAREEQLAAATNQQELIRRAYAPADSQEF